MKSNSWKLAVILTAFSVSMTAQAQVPNIGESGHSAGADVRGNMKSKTAKMAKSLPSGVTITVTSMLLPVKTSANWIPAADKVISAAKMNSVTNAVVNDPTDYSVLGYQIAWNNLVYSTSANMWNGTLNPATPFDTEFGQVIWNLIDATSDDDDISLDMISFKSESNDGNVLGDTITFGGLTYTPRAIAIRKDGTVIDSGDTSQKGSRVLVLVFTKLFNGGGTQAGLDAVRDWVAQRGDYDIKYSVKIVGYDSTTSTATRNTLPGSPNAPRLFIASSNEGVKVWVGNGESDTTYRVYARPLINEGKWVLKATLMSTAPKTLPVETGKTMFYSASVQ